MNGKAQDAAASLEAMPPEILLRIVMNLPGLDTLWNLMTVSPNTWRLFNNYALTITEGIISGPDSILYEKIRELVRGVILVRAKTLPFKDLKQFRTWLSKGVNPSIGQFSAEYMTPDTEILSASIMSPEVFRSVAATSCQISALSQGCLASYLASFRSIRPLHALDPRPYSPDHGPDSCRAPAWELDIGGKPHKVMDAGQPSWREEMRALRAMWIMQLVGEIKGLVKEGWSEEDINMLQHMNPADLVERPGSVIKAEEIRSTMEYLKTLGDAIQNDHYRLPKPPLATKRHRWLTSEQKPDGSFIPRVSSLARPNCNQPLSRRRAASKLTRGSGTTSMAPQVRVLTDDMRWYMVEPRLNTESSGMSVWRILSGSRNSPLYGIKFDSFRRLGFAFWDKKRLHLVSLASGIHEPHHQHYFYFFALESILPADEVANIKADIRVRGVSRITPRFRSRDLTPLPPAPPLPASSSTLSTGRSTLGLSSLSTTPVSGSHETH
ncbi:hypothetical protein NW768_001172 [Fusarium equiseti]|uniref:F-box domain-containing protein n=1 Tax=Fusarium equiseti TaxID=61235 RepID=A0ABQ8RPQ4_FUSEQ|nr:hypothetical protein NW768_001172 [Fusarium equiseti]